MSDFRDFRVPIGEDAARAGEQLMQFRPETQRSRKRRPGWAAVAVLAVVLTLSVGAIRFAGRGEPDPTATSAATSSTASTTPSPPLATSSATSLSDRELANGTPIPGPALPAGAGEAAANAVAAYARSQDATTWWARVRPLLTPDAQQVYAGSDPRGVAWTKVSGPGVALSGVNAPQGVVLVQVPTDAGVVVAHLRHDASDWLIERFDQPQRPRP